MASQVTFCSFSNRSTSRRERISTRSYPAGILASLRPGYRIAPVAGSRNTTTASFSDHWASRGLRIPHHTSSHGPPHSPHWNRSGMTMTNVSLVSRPHRVHRRSTKRGMLFVLLFPLAEGVTPARQRFSAAPANPLVPVDAVLDFLESLVYLVFGE